MIAISCQVIKGASVNTSHQIQLVLQTVNSERKNWTEAAKTWHDTQRGRQVEHLFLVAKLRS